MLMNDGRVLKEGKSQDHKLAANYSGRVWFRHSHIGGVDGASPRGRLGTDELLGLFFLGSSSSVHGMSGVEAVPWGCRQLKVD